MDARVAGEDLDRADAARGRVAVAHGGDVLAQLAQHARRQPEPEHQVVAPTRASRQALHSPARRSSRSPMAPSSPRKSSIAAFQWPARAGDQLDRLERQQRADHSPGCPHGRAGFGSAPGEGRGSDSTGSRRGGRSVAQPSSPAVPPITSGTRRSRQASLSARRERPVVGAIEHDVVPECDRGGVFGFHPGRVRIDLHAGVQHTELRRGALRAVRPDVRRQLEQSPPHALEGDEAVVDDADGPDPGGGEVGGRGAAQGAGADHQRAGAAQRGLGVRAEGGQCKLTRVTLTVRS